MKELNLCEILKGHEGETFYSPFCGSIKFNKILGEDQLIYCTSEDGNDVSFWPSGVPYMTHGECMLFPSKDQRDWNKWVEEQKTKTPKTWSEMKMDNTEVSVVIRKLQNKMLGDPVIKSALALLKIHQLIEVGYGGNVSNEEWSKSNVKYVIKYDPTINEFYVDKTLGNIYHLVFHTKKQAEEFLSYPENVQLLKDYFMI